MGWISVKDRLPELKHSDNHPTEPMLESDLVLVYDGNTYNLARFFKVGNYKTVCFQKATNWMPLPPVPGEVSE